MVLIIDNYDSFTYNLVQYLGEFQSQLEVHRNDAITVETVLAKNPSHIVISPGPCTPNEAGISLDLIKNLPSHIPLLGVCLGHQSIGQAFGGIVKRAPYLMHGKISAIHHEGKGIFTGLPSPFSATRYHSLLVERESLPNNLEITAWTADNLIMGLKHRSLPIYGVQFHPESILTDHGKALIANFLKTRIA